MMFPKPEANRRIIEVLQRIGSAIVLIPIVIGAIVFGGIYFNSLMFLALLLMLIEWTKISYKKKTLFISGIIYIVGAMLFWWLNTNIQHLLLFVLPLVWAIDVSAYIGGSLLGGPKLAPKISPKKTWSGAIIGFLTALFTYFMYIKTFRWIPTYTNFFVTVLCAILAILGDLLESKVKRIFGVKDSGSLIPGHGGVLDRLDSFLAVTWGLIILSMLK